MLFIYLIRFKNLSIYFHIVFCLFILFLYFLFIFLSAFLLHLVQIRVQRLATHAYNHSFISSTYISALIECVNSIHFIIVFKWLINKPTKKEINNLAIFIGHIFNIKFFLHLFSFLSDNFNLGLLSLRLR